jgi:hypothetical protein
MSAKENRRLVGANALAQGIHNRLLETNTGLQDAYEDACVWIGELYLALEAAERSVSAGYVRTNTAHLKWQSDKSINPVDDGDAWISTGGANG